MAICLGNLKGSVKNSLIFFVIYKLFVYLHKQFKNSDMKTIREIRKILFDADQYAVIGADEMTNKEAREYLYNLADQDATMNVIDNGTHLLIW